MLTNLPFVAELKDAVFNMNLDGVPGPDGFGAFFFQKYFIEQDVINAVGQFFTQGCCFLD